MRTEVRASSGKGRRSRGPGTKRPGTKRPGTRGKGRRVWVVLVTVALVGVLFTTVFPTRTFLAQRATLRASTEELGVINEDNRLLEERIRLLNDDTEIELMVRKLYLWVRPGERAFAVLPAPGPPEARPGVDAPPEADDGVNAVGRVWNWFTGLF